MILIISSWSCSQHHAATHVILSLSTSLFYRFLSFSLLSLHLQSVLHLPHLSFPFSSPYHPQWQQKHGCCRRWRVFCFRLCAGMHTEWPRVTPSQCLNHRESLRQNRAAENSRCHHVSWLRFQHHGVRTAPREDYSVRWGSLAEDILQDILCVLYLCNACKYSQCCWEIGIFNIRPCMKYW